MPRHKIQNKTESKSNLSKKVFDWKFAELKINYVTKTKLYILVICVSIIKRIVKWNVYVVKVNSF